jgi:hypothetical protein
VTFQCFTTMAFDWWRDLCQCHPVLRKWTGQVHPEVINSPWRTIFWDENLGFVWEELLKFS